MIVFVLLVVGLCSCSTVFGPRQAVVVNVGQLDVRTPQGFNDNPMAGIYLTQGKLYKRDGSQATTPQQIRIPERFVVRGVIDSTLIFYGEERQEADQSPRSFLAVSDVVCVSFHPFV